MPRPLGHMRILFSSRVLFDLEAADQIFKEKGEQAYTDYLLCQGEYSGQGDPSLNGVRRLGKGPLFDFALALAKLNLKGPIVELGMSCKDNIPSACAIFENFQTTEALANGMESCFSTSGSPVDAKMHEAFETDLFLTRNAADAQVAIDLGIAAAVINFPPVGTYDYDISGGPVRIIVDGDAVAFGDSAEVGFRNDVATVPDYGQAVSQYKNREHQERHRPVEAGPFTRVLAKISELNSRFPRGAAPFEIGLLTARGALANARAVVTLKAHGIKFNYASGFLGGADKGVWLKAHRPHLFFDDQKTHLDRGMLFCPTGLVPYKTGGAMHEYQMRMKAEAAAAQSNVSTAVAFKDAAQPGDKEGKGADCADMSAKKSAPKRGRSRSPS